MQKFNLDGNFVILFSLGFGWFYYGRIHTFSKLILLKLKGEFQWMEILIIFITLFQPWTIMGPIKTTCNKPNNLLNAYIYIYSSITSFTRNLVITFYNNSPLSLKKYTTLIFASKSTSTTRKVVSTLKLTFRLYRSTFYLSAF